MTSQQVLEKNAQVYGFRLKSDNTVEWSDSPILFLDGKGVGAELSPKTLKHLDHILSGQEEELKVKLQECKAGRVVAERLFRGMIEAKKK